jgi:hypothetical protein
MEAAIVSHRKKSLESDRYPEEFYQTFKEEVMPTHLKLFHEIERERTLPYSFHEDTIRLIPKIDKDTTKKKRERIIV